MSWTHLLLLPGWPGEFACCQLLQMARYSAAGVTFPLHRLLEQTALGMHSMHLIAQHAQLLPTHNATPATHNRCACNCGARREMYENLIQQLVPLLAKAAGAVDLLNRSDINWLDGTGSSKPYKAGGFRVHTLPRF